MTERSDEDAAPVPPPPDPPPPLGPPAYPPHQPTPPPTASTPPLPGPPPPTPMSVGAWHQRTSPSSFAPPPPYGPAPAPTAPRRDGTVIAGGVTMLAGALLAIVGSLVPWLSFDGFGEKPNGFETYPLFGDGADPLLWTNPGAYVIAAYGLVSLLAIIVLAAGRATWSAVCAIVTALIGGAASLASVVAIADVINNFRGLDVGLGIVMVGLAAVVSFVGSLIVAIAR